MFSAESICPDEWHQAYIHITLFNLGKIFSVLKSDNFIIKKYIKLYTLHSLFYKIAGWGTDD